MNGVSWNKVDYSIIKAICNYSDKKTQSAIAGVCKQWNDLCNEWKIERFFLKTPQFIHKIAPSKDKLKFSGCVLDQGKIAFLFHNDKTSLVEVYHCHKMQEVFFSYQEESTILNVTLHGSYIGMTHQNPLTNLSIWNIETKRSVECFYNCEMASFFSEDEVIYSKKEEGKNHFTIKSLKTQKIASYSFPHIASPIHISADKKYLALSFHTNRTKCFVYDRQGNKTKEVGLNDPRTCFISGTSLFAKHDEYYRVEHLESFFNSKKYPIQYFNMTWFCSLGKFLVYQSEDRLLFNNTLDSKRQPWIQLNGQKPLAFDGTIFIFQDTKGDIIMEGFDFPFVKEEL